MLPTQKLQSKLPQQQKQQKKKQQQQLPAQEQIKLTVTKENPWIKNIMFPPQIDIDSLGWFPITVIYKPKSTRKTRNFGGGSLIFETQPEEYIFHALGYVYDGNKLIVKPTSFQRRVEFEDVFGKHDSLQKLHQGRTYPLVQINTQNTLQSL